MNEKVIIDATHVSKSFGDGEQTVDVLSNVSLAVHEGESVAILGKSGAGKSTLLHILAGLERPTSGRVSIDGQRIERLSDEALCKVRNEKIGFIYQFHHLLPEFNLTENVAMPLLIRGVKPKEALRQAHALLEEVELSHRLAARIQTLSGGERQRGAIARALVTNPSCVLADEPTGNLDGQTAKNISSLLLELNQRKQLSLVVVTHDLELADMLDRTYRIGEGHHLTKEPLKPQPMPVGTAHE